MHQQPSPKTALFDQLALLGRGLGSAARLELLDFLAQGPRPVERLAALSGLSVANTSKHLQQLRTAGLVEAERQGKSVVYHLADDRVIVALDALRQVAENRLQRVQELIAGYLTRRDQLEPVSATQLLERMRDGLVAVLDVRPVEEFEHGHIAGAINVPLSELDERIGELPAGVEIVAYCRGPWCVLSFEAVQRLRQAGYQASRFEQGLPEWRSVGLPVETACAILTKPLRS